MILESFYVRSRLRLRQKCTENKALKEYKHLRRIRQEYFAVHADNPDVDIFSSKTQKIQILNHLPLHYQLSNKTISSYWALKSGK